MLQALCNRFSSIGDRELDYLQAMLGSCTTCVNCQGQLCHSSCSCCDHKCTLLLSPEDSRQPMEPIRMQRSCFCIWFGAVVSWRLFDVCLMCVSDMLVLGLILASRKTHRDSKLLLSDLYLNCYSQWFSVFACRNRFWYLLHIYLHVCFGNL